MIKNYTLLILLSFSLGLAAQISFNEEAIPLGLDEPCGTTPFGNGVAIYDYDQDGWDDITMATEAGMPFRFFKNINGAFFEQYFAIIDSNDQTKQVNWVDYDNDGDKDFFVASNTAGNKLYNNNGFLSFTDVTEASGLPIDTIFTWGTSWGDYNNDGHLDIFFCNRDGTFSTPNYLYKNNGDGTFTNVSHQAGIRDIADLSLCAAFLDINNDGLQDIYVSNDKTYTSNTLYLNKGDGTFADISESSNTNLYFDAMSVTVDDYNNDGWFDIYVTNSPEGNALLKNNGDNTFTDVAASSGTLFNSVSWGAIFLDADNDTDMDLYVSGSTYTFNPNYASAAFYENIDGTTYQIPENIGFQNDYGASYSSAKGDINNDGLVDMVVSNSVDQNPFLWKNYSTSSNNWLKVKLEGTESNRDGIGSRIELAINDTTKLYRYTHCGEGFLSQNSATENFGVGQATQLDYVKVTWLSGIVDVFYNIDVNQLLEIQEGSSTLSTNDFSLTNVFKIYPNPATDVITVKSNQNPIETVSIIDVLGRQVLNFKNDSQFKEVTLDVSNLPDGTYALKINTLRESHTKFIVKQ